MQGPWSAGVLGDDFAARTLHTTGVMTMRLLVGCRHLLRRSDGKVRAASALEQASDRRDGGVREGRRNLEAENVEGESRLSAMMVSGNSCSIQLSCGPLTSDRSDGNSTTPHSGCRRGPFPGTWSARRKRYCHPRKWNRHRPGWTA